VSISPLHQSVRPSPLFLALIAVTAAGGVAAWLAAEPAGAMAYGGVFVFVVAGWLVSLCLHEFGHAYTAWRFGDRDVAARGYLTLNPLKYTHPLLSLALPVLFIAIGGIGLPGGAVYVRTGWMTKNQRTLVSLAGPAVNLAFAIVLLVVARLLYDPAHLVFWSAVSFLAFLQITAFLLNILPIPGLDGYGALEPHLSPETQRAVAPAKQWGFLILLLLVFAPGVNRWFFSAVYGLFELSGVSPYLSMVGGQLTRFWSAWT